MTSLYLSQVRTMSPLSVSQPGGADNSRLTVPGLLFASFWLNIQPPLESGSQPRHGSGKGLIDREAPRRALFSSTGMSDIVELGPARFFIAQLACLILAFYARNRWHSLLASSTLEGVAARSIDNLIELEQKA